MPLPVLFPDEPDIGQVGGVERIGKSPVERARQSQTRGGNRTAEHFGDAFLVALLEVLLLGFEAVGVGVVARVEGKMLCSGDKTERLVR